MILPERSILNQRYRIDKYIGSGGMAEVYKAWDTQRAAYVALKLLNANLSEDLVFLRHFQQEGKALQELAHDNIVQFYELVEADHLTFLVMKFIDGITLRTEIYQRRSPYTARRILEIFEPICSALFYAHNRHIIHCDVKPANIMIESTGRILLTDFGISRLADTVTTATAFRTAGAPAYMAPELVMGLRPRPATDVYSLGIILYELLSGGMRPFFGETAQITGSPEEKVRWEQVNQPPPSIRLHNPEVSPMVEQVMLRCLEKDPANRFSTTQELFGALVTAFTNEDQTSRGTTGQATLPSSARFQETFPATQISPNPPEPAQFPPYFPPQEPYPTQSPAFQEYPPQAPTLPQHTPPPPPQSGPPRAARKRGYWWLLAVVLVAGVVFAIIKLIPIISPPAAMQPTEPAPTQGFTAEPTLPQSLLASPTVVKALLPTVTSMVIPTSTFPPPTYTPPPPTATSRPSSAQVLWDITHGPRQSETGLLYIPSGLYKKLDDLIGFLKINLVESQQPLDKVNLNLYQAVVLSATSVYSSDITENEAEALVSYVARGGGLLVLAENDQFTNHFQAVLSRVGVAAMLKPDIYTVSQLPDHPIFKNVKQIEFLYSGGSLSYAGKEKITAASVSGSLAVIALPFSSGRAVFIGDSNLFDDRGLGSNDVFAQNVFKWVTGMID